ncbi:MAG: dTMP kinase [Clostridia bacterium]|nr:dTMP kinase [Clostridia bacterium]MBQ5956553.1 dTMP kinase [Clostridia bacterium]MBR6823049.1 dTMP kinase [Clostridia bacterium]
MKGLFITFEGIDGSGKSTQIDLATRYLTEKGYRVYLTREPGGCPISEKIREVLLDPENKGMDPITEALLYAAARAQLIDSVLLEKKNEGYVILCDRYLDSSIAYQAFGRDLGVEFVKTVNRAADKMVPDMTLYFKLSQEQCDERINRQLRDRDRLERESVEFFQRVIAGFDYIAKTEPDRVKTIKADDSIERIALQIRVYLDGLLEGTHE